VNIVVCIKQVVGSTRVKLDPATGTLVRESAEAIVNPVDEHAIEAALRLKERLGGVVQAITMGPPRAEAALRVALAMGVDEGYLVTDRILQGSDTWATSRVLGLAIRALGVPRLVVCGAQAIDGDTGQVGPELAELMGIPCVAGVRRIVNANRDCIRVERVMEDGVYVIDMLLPGLITVTRQTNVARVPTLKGRMRARRATLRRWNAAELAISKAEVGLHGSPTRVLRSFSPQPRPPGVKVTGELSLLVDTMVAAIDGARPTRPERLDSGQNAQGGKG
jgi:electron transfer flavoprotein beta subunit